MWPLAMVDVGDDIIVSIHNWGHVKQILSNQQLEVCKYISITIKLSFPYYLLLSCHNCTFLNFQNKITRL